LARGEITKYLDALSGGVFGAGTNEEGLFSAIEQITDTNVVDVAQELQKLIGDYDHADFDIGDAGIGNGFDRLLRGELSKEDYNRAVSILQGNGLYAKRLRSPQSGVGGESHYIWWVPRIKPNK
jgi:hypothetical protein